MSRIAQAALMLTLFRVGLLPPAYGQRYTPCNIPSGSTVFIPTGDEFGKELKKALLEAGVQMVFVSDMGNADFEIVGKVEDSEQLKSTESPRVEGSSHRTARGEHATYIRCQRQHSEPENQRHCLGLWSDRCQ